jgi:hypothetical protein
MNKDLSFCNSMLDHCLSLAQYIKISNKYGSEDRSQDINFLKDQLKILTHKCDQYLRVNETFKYMNMDGIKNDRNNQLLKGDG